MCACVYMWVCACACVCMYVEEVGSGESPTVRTPPSSPENKANTVPPQLEPQKFQADTVPPQLERIPEILLGIVEVFCVAPSNMILYRKCLFVTSLFLSFLIIAEFHQIQGHQIC